MLKNTPINTTLLIKQVEPLFKSTLSGGLANIFAALLVCMIFQESTLQEYAYKLTGVIVVLSIIRILFSQSYLKNKRFKLNTYLYLHIFLTFLIGVTWGVFEFIPHYGQNSFQQSIMYIFGFGLIAGSTATLSIHKETYLAYIIPQAISIFYVFTLLDNEAGFYLVYAFLFFMLFMISASFNINKSRKNEIGLILKNRVLINDLNHEIKTKEEVQLELEESKTNLEVKVKKRTKDLIDINLHLENVILEKEEAEQSLQYLAYHDELTGLPNRNLLVDRINQSIKISARDQQQMAVLFLDLDRFKSINDSLGHNVGDELLKEIPTRLYGVLRSHDTVSRNGGDEFVVVLEKLKDTSEAVYVAKKIIKCLTETFNIQSHTIHIGASVGISVYPEDGDTPLILLRNADTAMYRAKQSGGRQLQFYDESMSHQLRDRLELESELHKAIDNNEFYMVYQPKVDCNTGETVGFESLIRWNNAKYGEIGPDRFIPVLEETGMIYDVGVWVVTEVLTFIKQYNTDNQSFSINLSALQCNNFDFIVVVNDLINNLKIAPNKIEFEITESLLIKDFEKTKLFLDEIHAIGITIALDDFGTGYTSMNYLAQLPIDVIKIDKSFIQNIDTNVNLQSIVKAIVTMSKSMGIGNVFEGVETYEELTEIKKMNGEIIQGYLYSKPLKVDEINKWLTINNHQNALTSS
ncbi:MAG: EAL domain-containing protein [Methylococcaceae bacterium]